MGFLKRFFGNVMQQEAAAPRTRSSFSQLSEAELEAHLDVSKYGSFRLTDAIRPSYDLQVRPQQGYRHDQYRDEQNGSCVPVLMAAASREILFDLFLDILDPLGGEVDLVLETSHRRDSGRHQDLYREHIDTPVLKSILCDYEDLLLNDGCTGIAVLNPAGPQEVQFDEHKLLIIYGEPLGPFEDVLESHGVRCHDSMRFITEAEHVHSSREEFIEQFDELRMRLGMDEMYS